MLCGFQWSHGLGQGSYPVGKPSVFHTLMPTIEPAPNYGVTEWKANLWGTLSAAPQPALLVSRKWAGCAQCRGRRCWSWGNPEVAWAGHAGEGLWSPRGTRPTMSGQRSTGGWVNKRQNCHCLTILTGQRKQKVTKLQVPRIIRCQIKATYVPPTALTAVETWGSIVPTKKKS